ncbi:MAG: hypothetical protein QM791_11255 [Ferruginibacter sp.]
MQKTNMFKAGAVLMGISLLFVMALFSCNNDASTTAETPKDTTATVAPAPTDTLSTNKSAPDTTTVIDTSKTGQNPPPPRNK